MLKAVENKSVSDIFCINAIKDPVDEN